MALNHCPVRHSELHSVGSGEMLNWVLPAEDSGRILIGFDYREPG